VRTQLGGRLAKEQSQTNKHQMASDILGEKLKTPPEQHIA